MKSSRLITRLALACQTTALSSVFATLVGLSSGGAHAQVSVSSSGSPSFSQGIEVPPGVAGMSPKLAIMYSGGGVNGPLGYGWSLQGISTITRCAATKATDGIKGAVKYLPSDKLCLDGQRLIQTNEAGSPSASINSQGLPVVTQINDSQGLPGATNYREFRTEKDSFVRIRAYGYANGDSSGVSGPKYFKVWTKSGQVYEYGDSPNSDTNTTKALINAKKVGVADKPMAWAVARISDTMGNAMNFKYEQRTCVVGSSCSWGSGPGGMGPMLTNPTPGNEWNLLEIQYANNKVILNYDPADSRTDKSEAYHLGFKNISARLLTSITTYTNSIGTGLGKLPNSIAVKTTKLGYDYGVISKRKRVTSVQTCVGEANSTRCAPATSFEYGNGGDEAYAANANFASSSLKNLQLQSTTGSLGILLGDFDGDGRTDILRWSDTPADNKLFLSSGDGNFTEPGAFNLKQATDTLFHSNKCYYTVVTDLNGDGLPDFFRFANSSCSGAAPTTMYLNKGDGSFTEIPYAATNPVLARNTSINQYNGLSKPRILTGWTEGNNFYLMDVDGDGKADIVKATLPAFYADIDMNNVEPSGDNVCETIMCNQVYLGDGAGGFVLKPNTNPPGTPSMYIAPVYGSIVTVRNIVDVNGDGLADLTGVKTNWTNNSPVFVSKGNGTFEKVPPGTISNDCQVPIDFNGDGRADCLMTGDGLVTTLMVADGTGTLPVVNTNLGNPGLETSGADSNGVSTTGIRVVDINGDGRQDVLRWKTAAAGITTADNAIYLSKGDGLFTTSGSFNISDVLVAMDGTVDVAIGDFSGKGNAEFLRVKTNTAGTVNDNVLYTKTNSMPLDQLSKVISSMGLATNLFYTPITAATGSRYTSERVPGTITTGPIIDVAFPMYVVTTSIAATGVGTASTTTEYAYKGLKVDTTGRGMLGFHEVLRQSLAGDGTSPLTVRTVYLQKYPYIGVASRSDTRVATWGSPSVITISETSNIYCDKSASTTAELAATEALPCPATEPIQRPYLYQSTESGWDIDPARTPLPKVVTKNVFNSSGDATKITVTTSGLSAGIAQEQVTTKVVDNIYDQSPALTAGDDWILGRLINAKVTNTVPDLRTNLTPSAGNGAFATATSGTGGVPPALGLRFTSCVNSGPTTTPTKATYTCTLSNNSPTAVSSITYGSPAYTDVTGPSNCAANISNCGTVLVSTPTTTAAGTYTGVLTATPNPGNQLASLEFTLTVNPPPPTLTVTRNPNPMVAGQTYTISWSTNGTSITYTCTAGGTGFNGSLTVAPNSSVTGIADEAWVGYPSTCTWVASNGTSTATFVETMTTNLSPPLLTLAGCINSGEVFSPSRATYTCTLGNTGSTVASAVTYSSGAGTVTGPATCAAKSSNCGTVVVTSSTTVGNYAGTLTATPNAGTPVTSASFTLQVKEVGATLSLSGCTPSAATTSPTKATYTCSLSNTGTGLSGSITYSSAAGTVVGPSSCWGNGACGTVIVSSPTGQGSYLGTVTATPTTGTAVTSESFTLVVNPPAPTLSVTRTPNPMLAGQPYTVTWNSNGTSVSYACTASGTGFNGSASRAASGSATDVASAQWVNYPSTCTWTAYNGASTTVVTETMTTQLSQSALTLSGCVNSGSTVSPTRATYTCTLGNAGGTNATGIAYAIASGSASSMTVNGPFSCAGNTTNCGSVVVTSGTGPGSYYGPLTATPYIGAAVTSAAFMLTVNPAPSLDFVNCVNSGAINAPTPATYTCSIRNWGGVATAISYSSTAGATSGGPTSCAANAVNCGSVVVTSPTTAGSYTGTLTMTPSAGTGSTTGSFTLTVNPAPTPPALSLVGCGNSGATTTPTQATYTCTLRNLGGTAASFVSYYSAAGSVDGPASCAANNSNCGNVVVYSPTTGGNYSATLTATPNAGSGATTASFTLVVNPPAPTLSVSRPYPMVAGQGFTVTWSSTNATSVSYSCSAGGSGFSGSGSLPVNGSASDTASSAWVGYNSSCTWTATGAGGSKVVYETLVTVDSSPTISIQRSPSPMRVGQSYTVYWGSTNATSVSYTCSASGTGFSGSGTLPTTNGSTSGTASSAWVGYPSSCTWTATGPGGSASYQESMYTTN